jgi:hypothetical protein
MFMTVSFFGRIAGFFVPLDANRFQGAAFEPQLKPQWNRMPPERKQTKVCA